MDTHFKEKSIPHGRDNLVEEQTFVAWIRTSIALMGFGFVVAHFGISADGSHIGQHAGLQPHEPTLWFGTLIIVFGVAVNLFSAWRFVGLACELRRGPVLRRYLWQQGVIVALVLALLGVGMTIYMISISGARAGAMGQ
jgi:putative membrane protein